MTALRESLTAAIVTRLSGTGGATIERTRITPINLDTETMPRLVVTAGDWSADETQEPGYTHYTMTFSVTGFVRPVPGPDELDAEKALNALHAAVVTQLVGWRPSVTGGSIQELGAEFDLYATENSLRPAGDFVAQFTLLAIASTGNPNV